MPQPLRKPPEKLATIIRLINLVSPETNLLEFDEAFPVTTNSDAILKELHPEHWLSTKMEKVGFAQPFRDYVLERGFEKAIARYESFRVSRHSLRRLIKRGGYPILSTRAIEVDREGLIELGPDELSAALIGVEAKRICECAVCRRIFWAGRVTQKTCSAKCRNTLSVRKWRKGKTKIQ